MRRPRTPANQSATAFSVCSEFIALKARSASSGSLIASPSSGVPRVRSNSWARFTVGDGSFCPTALSAAAVGGRRLLVNSWLALRVPDV